MPEQLWGGADAVFRHRHFRYFQCAVCIFSGISKAEPWNLDLFVSGTSGSDADGAPETVCAVLLVQLCGRIFLRETVHEAWINILPTAIGWRVLYFVASYLILCLGIALSNRCKLPIIPTDLFPRDLSKILSAEYSKVKVSFDVICLAVTACLTGVFLHHIRGLGIGTIVAAFTMGKTIGIIGSWMDKKMDFTSVLEKSR